MTTGVRCPLRPPTLSASSAHPPRILCALRPPCVLRASSARPPCAFRPSSLHPPCIPHAQSPASSLHHPRISAHPPWILPASSAHPPCIPHLLGSLLSARLWVQRQRMKSQQAHCSLTGSRLHSTDLRLRTLPGAWRAPITTSSELIGRFHWRDGSRPISGFLFLAAFITVRNDCRTRVFSARRAPSCTFVRGSPPPQCPGRCRHRGAAW